MGDDPAYLRALPRGGPRIRGDVCTLVGEFSNYGNYFHWLHDGLLRLHGLEEHLPERTRYVVPAGIEVFKLDTLRLLGITEDRLLRHDRGDAWVCDHLWFSSLPSSSSTNPEAATWLRDRLLTGAGVTRTAPTRRLFLSRVDATHARIVDEDGLVPVLARHGFERVLPGTMTVEEQIRTFAEAAFVVGPTGAGFANLMFCDPTTRVLEILEPGWAEHKGYVIWAFAEVFGQPFAYLMGRSVPNPADPTRADLSVDPDALDRALATWLGRG